MNADLDRGCSLYTMDVIGRRSREKLFPDDVATCAGLGRKDGEDVVCRMLELFFVGDVNGIR